MILYKQGALKTAIANFYLLKGRYKYNLHRSKNTFYFQQISPLTLNNRYLHKLNQAGCTNARFCQQ